MLAPPLTPTKAHAQYDIDCLSRHAIISPTRGSQSSESARSPLAITIAAPPAPTPMSLPQPARKRPRLSLQTSDVPVTFGKSSTALALAAASADPTASPTVLNTFSNAYDLPHRFSPARNPGSPSAPRSARLPPRLVSPFASSGKHFGRPYSLPRGVKGILRNGPIPCSLSIRRSSFCPHSPGSPRAGRKALFPAAKKVAFRQVLDEEIQTTTYTAKHSDLCPFRAAKSLSKRIPRPSPSTAEEKSVFESDSSEDDGDNNNNNNNNSNNNKKDDEDDNNEDDEDDDVHESSDNAQQESSNSSSSSSTNTINPDDANDGNNSKGKSQRQIEAVAIRDQVAATQSPHLPPSTPTSATAAPRNWVWTLASPSS